LVAQLNAKDEEVSQEWLRSRETAKYNASLGCSLLIGAAIARRVILKI
jgi:hypothetical protein